MTKYHLTVKNAYYDQHKRHQLLKDIMGGHYDTPMGSVISICTLHDQKQRARGLEFDSNSKGYMIVYLNIQGRKTAARGLKMSIQGHDEMALERFMTDTRHMIIYDVLDSRCKVGSPGEQLRLYLSDTAYQQARDQEQAGYIRITKHAAVVAGDIV